MTTISFIIPAYNASNTIVRTMDSILKIRIPVEHMEIIVVDDCSTDSTREVVRKYAQMHPQVQLLCQPENHRQGAARNRGLAIAKGDFVMFVDSDDYVNDGLRDALNRIKQSDADAVFCKYTIETSFQKEVENPVPLTEMKVYTGPEFCSKYYDTSVGNYVWAYIWRRSSILSIHRSFIEDRRYEDTDWIQEVLYACGKIIYSNANIYIYNCVNTNSTSHTISTDTLGDWVNMAYRQWIFAEEIKDNAPLYYDKLIFSCRHIVNGHFSFRRLSRFKPSQVKEIFERVGETALKYLASKGGWARFPSLCFRSRRLAICVVAVSYPLTSFGRKVVSFIRKLRYHVSLIYHTIL